MLGASGAGKSDLALRLIDAGAELVADDQVMVAGDEGGLFAAPAPKLAGLLEVRGIGVVTLSHLAQARLRLAVMLVTRAEVERMPEAQFYCCAGQQLPLLSLHGFDRATEAKIRLALSQMTGGGA